MAITRPLVAARQVRQSRSDQAEEGALDRFGGGGQCLVGQFGKWGAVGEPGIADQDVQAAKAVYRGGHECGRHGRVGEVTERHVRQGAGVAGVLRHRFGRVAVAAGVDEHGGFRPGHDAADRGADAAGGAGDQNGAGLCHLLAVRRCVTVVSVWWCLMGADADAQQGVTPDVHSFDRLGAEAAMDCVAAGRVIGRRNDPTGSDSP